MVQFETQVYHKEGTDIVGAEVIVIAESGERIGTLQITSKTEFDELVAQLNNLTEEFISFDENSELAGMTIDDVLANTDGDININASKLGGYTANQYSRTNHTHNTSDISNLYNVDISSSNQNPNVDDSITLTVKVTNMSNQPVGSKNIVIYKNGSSWKTGTTNSSGIFTTNYTIESDADIVFKVENEKLIVSPKPYWATISTSIGTLLVCEKLRLADYFLSASVNLTADTKKYLNSNNAVIPSSYRPLHINREFAHDDLNSPKLLGVDADGKVWAKSSNGGTFGLTGYFMWHY